jgi:hypothetical protein
MGLPSTWCIGRGSGLRSPLMHSEKQLESLSAGDHDIKDGLQQGVKTL